ncbi:hypothetical protein ACLB9Y_12935 [Chryseobacterium scophthalmum]|uniref:hypothetical protein n=1 Tax=Chryseobacterium scophthalmum TaxID=59733 RepID=UPI00398B7896
MKKNLFLRLCLMMAVSIFVYACRTDHLPENETTYNNSSKFQLTSKRISLNDAKHKIQLLPELNNAEAKFKTISTIDANGKVIDYGNGVSIDTEDIIYIENGPNYHTYTFRIIRSNAPAGAPVENLLLTPLPDGTYKEFLIRYNLTDNEKLQIQNNEFVDTKNKTQIIELSTGNASGILGKSQSCSYETVTINISCA